MTIITTILIHLLVIAC